MGHYEDWWSEGREVCMTNAIDYDRVKELVESGAGRYPETVYLGFGEDGSRTRDQATMREYCEICDIPGFEPGTRVFHSRLLGHGHAVVLAADPKGRVEIFRVPDMGREPEGTLGGEELETMKEFVDKNAGLILEQAKELSEDMAEPPARVDADLSGLVRLANARGRAVTVYDSDGVPQADVVPRLDWRRHMGNSDFEKHFAKRMEDPEFRKVWDDDQPTQRLWSAVEEAKATEDIDHETLGRLSGLGEARLEKIQVGDGDPKWSEIVAIARALEREPAIGLGARGEAGAAPKARTAPDGRAPARGDAGGAAGRDPSGGDGGGGRFRRSELSNEAVERWRGAWERGAFPDGYRTTRGKVGDTVTRVWDEVSIGDIPEHTRLICTGVMKWGDVEVLAVAPDGSGAVCALPGLRWNMVHGLGDAAMRLLDEIVHAHAAEIMSFALGAGGEGAGTG